jgi:Secretion system C-terminal sorting domain
VINKKTFITHVDGNPVGSVDANQSRPDLGTAFGNAAAILHGYTYQVPAGSVIKNGQWHTIQVKPCDGSFLPHHNNSSQASLQCAGGQGNRIGVFDNSVLSSPDNNEILTVYPNPANESIQVRFTLPNASKVILKVFNSIGQQVLMQDKFGEKGVNVFELDISKLVSGKYEIVVEAKSFIQSISLIKN